MKNRYRFAQILLLFALTYSKTLPAQTYTYDHFNRLTQITYPDGATITYTYDKLGNRLSEVKSGTGVALNLRAYLHGPYHTGAGKMNDQLRILGLIPAAEPYTALGLAPLNSGSCMLKDSASVFSDKGDDSLVDWMLVELRDAADPGDILYSQPFLLQRDGDVVDLDGASPPVFRDAPAGEYYVAIRHRNHLGVMTAAPLALSSTRTLIDFTDGATSVYGTNARKSLGNGKWGLWGGDVNGNKNVKYNGSANDRLAILGVVGLATPNNILTLYSRADTNLDGLVKNNGASNDRNVILATVGLGTPNAVVVEQVPQ